MPAPTRGNAAEAAVLNALVDRDWEVLVPFGDGQPYDLVLHAAGTSFLRIQCKRAWPRGGCLIFNSRATDHGSGPRSYVGLADIFGVYFPPTRSVYLVPIEAVAPTEGRLRVEPTRNNQRRHIRAAADYEVERWTTEALVSIAASSPSAHPLRPLSAVGTLVT
jgi:PD-(D/E)XK endonuclease